MPPHRRRLMAENLAARPARIAIIMYFKLLPYGPDLITFAGYPAPVSFQAEKLQPPDTIRTQTRHLFIVATPIGNRGYHPPSPAG
jgi:hypothetical protein